METASRDTVRITPVGTGNVPTAYVFRLARDESSSESSEWVAGMLFGGSPNVESLPGNMWVMSSLLIKKRRFTFSFFMAQYLVVNGTVRVGSLQYSRLPVEAKKAVETYVWWKF